MKKLVKKNSDFNPKCKLYNIECSNTGGGGNGECKIEQPPSNGLWECIIKPIGGKILGKS